MNKEDSMVYLLQNLAGAIRKLMLNHDTVDIARKLLRDSGVSFVDSDGIIINAILEELIRSISEELGFLSEMIMENLESGNLNGINDFIVDVRNLAYKHLVDDNLKSEYDNIQDMMGEAADTLLSGGTSILTASVLDKLLSYSKPFGNS